MFDFFGNGRKKSLDEMMKDLEEMLGSSYNPMGGGYVVGKSSTEKGTDENGDWTKETFTSTGKGLASCLILRASQVSNHSESKGITTSTAGFSLTKLAAAPNTAFKNPIKQVSVVEEFTSIDRRVQYD